MANMDRDAQVARELLSARWIVPAQKLDDRLAEIKKTSGYSEHTLKMLLFWAVDPETRGAFVAHYLGEHALKDIPDALTKLTEDYRDPTITAESLSEEMLTFLERDSLSRPSTNQKPAKQSQRTEVAARKPLTKEDEYEIACDLLYARKLGPEDLKVKLAERERLHGLPAAALDLLMWNATHAPTRGNFVAWFVEQYRGKKRKGKKSLPKAIADLVEIINRRGVRKSTLLLDARGSDYAKTRPQLKASLAKNL
ncbi:MAG: hypothetical protein Q7R83_04860 [bacterium]|nr:hypothetical protein [bacterium]